MGMKNCKACGAQMEDSWDVCPVCKIDNSKMVSEPIVENDDLALTIEEPVENEIHKTGGRKIEKIDVGVTKKAIKYIDIGKKLQVKVTFSDGSNICMRKQVAQMLYPEIFTDVKGDD